MVKGFAIDYLTCSNFVGYDNIDSDIPFNIHAYHLANCQGGLEMVSALNDNVPDEKT